jgi:hypothetical protein
MTHERGDFNGGWTDDEQPVLLYLAALEARRSPPAVVAPPEATAAALAGADMVVGNDRDQLETELAEATPGSEANVAQLEEGFVRAAAAYGRRHGITYEGWRQAGVGAEVLARAGIGPQDVPNEANAVIGEGDRAH